MKESFKLTETQVTTLYRRTLINHATWCNALRELRGMTTSHLGPHALAICEVEIEALVENAINAACKAIQDRLGVKSGDLAAATLADGTLERELTRYIHAELEAGRYRDVPATDEVVA